MKNNIKKSRVNVNTFDKAQKEAIEKYALTDQSRTDALIKDYGNMRWSDLLEKHNIGAVPAFQTLMANGIQPGVKNN